VGEQFIDLFTAGAYALVGRMFAALSSPSFSWLFYALAASGIVYALLESALEQRPDLWLRHLVAVGFASVLTLVPHPVDLAQLTYGAPGQVERIFGTHVGAAPHLTYWIERLGAAAATGLHGLTQSRPILAVPGVASQVDEIASDPASLNDPQLKANLEIWRRLLAPQLLRDHPDLAAQLRAAGLTAALLNPAPQAPQFVGKVGADRARQVQSILAGAGVDLRPLLQAQAPLLNQIAADAGATAWSIGAAGDSPATIVLAKRAAADLPRRTVVPAAAYSDALQRADSLAADLRAQLPQANTAATVASIDQLHDLLGRSILYSAGVAIGRDASARAAIGSLCQSTDDANCRAAMAPLIEASSRLRVSASDRYDSAGWTTWLEQPVTTVLLTVTSLLLGALSSLVVSVLPFALGIAKAIAIIISMLGAWILLWPGRARIALSWMVGPISFVSLWSVLFNLWADIEPNLSRIASVVGNAEHGSWSAGRAMSIAISLGYLGLPSLALGVIYGESGRALYHASARMENALMMAWHARTAIAAFGRRWLVNSPLARRWNQRAYRAVGLGPLRAPRAAAGSGATRRPRAAATPARARKPKAPAPDGGSGN
jgi:hypothetical protein